MAPSRDTANNRGDLKTVGLLVRYDMKVNIEKLITDESRTRLEIAVESSNPRIVEYLVNTDPTSMSVKTWATPHHLL